MESTQVDSVIAPVVSVTTSSGDTTGIDTTTHDTTTHDTTTHVDTTHVDTTHVDDTTGIDDEVARLGQELGRHARLLHLMKAHVPTLMPAGVDWATFAVLVQLAKCGATRQTDLAEISLLDPSTVSRHVGQLVRLDLVERRPDPQDGRAVRLIVTEHGRAIVEETVRRRNQAFLTALRGWRGEDLTTLTRLLTRFNDDLEAFHQNAGRTDTASASPPAHRADEAPA